MRYGKEIKIYMIDREKEGPIETAKTLESEKTSKNTPS
jgi:hypothetical protein